MTRHPGRQRQQTDDSAMWPGIETQLIIAQSSQLAVHIECAQKTKNKAGKAGNCRVNATSKYPAYTFENITKHVKLLYKVL